MVRRPETTSAELRERLTLLNCELAAAGCTKLSGDSAYMRDLRADLDETHGAWVIASVTEIALARAGVQGALWG